MGSLFAGYSPPRQGSTGAGMWDNLSLLRRPRSREQVAHFLSPLSINPARQCYPHLEQAFSPQLNLSGNTVQICVSWVIPNPVQLTVRSVIMVVFETYSLPWSFTAICAPLFFSQGSLPFGVSHMLLWNVFSPLRTIWEEAKKLPSFPLQHLYLALKIYCKDPGALPRSPLLLFLRHLLQGHLPW